jgi:hypothetical protein
VVHRSLSFAPRISERLLEALIRLDDRSVPMAEVNRRLGAEAARLKAAKPSYQRIRVLLHAIRRLKRERLPPTTGQILFDVWLRLRPVGHLVNHVYGEYVPARPP